MNHVYTILSVVEVEGNKLLRIRNPWGKETYTGDWNDSSSKWNTSLKNKVQYTFGDDGIFFVDYKTYKDEFLETQIHIDTLEMTQSYFLVTDDDSPIKANGPFCKHNNCQSTKHTFTVKSSAT
jgi:hypothetical protein